MKFSQDLSSLPLADPTFNSPQFTARCYSSYCFSDGRGRLLWSFVNEVPTNFAGADGVRVGGPGPDDV